MNGVSFGPLFIWAILRKLRSGFHSFEWMRCLTLCEKVTSHRDHELLRLKFFGMTSRVWSPVGLGGWSWFSVAADLLGSAGIICHAYVCFTSCWCRPLSNEIARPFFVNCFSRFRSLCRPLLFQFPSITVTNVVKRVVDCDFRGFVPVKNEPLSKMSS